MMSKNEGFGGQGNRTYDIAVNGGRVMEPLTRTDVMANVGTSGGKIATIVPAEKRLDGKVTIDATGLVVAPGFINIHGHGSGNGVGAEFHVLDGITTEVTGNCGFSGPLETSGASELSGYPLAEYFDELEQEGMVINLASLAGHITLREAVGVPDAFSPPTEEQIAKMVELLAQEMESGALGITFAPFYGPGTTYEEMVTLAKEASRLGGCAASHIRYSFAPRDLEAIAEAISTAREANIPFVLSHLAGPTVSHKSTGMALELIAEALEGGLRIATDCHPYEASCTFMGAPVFDQVPIEEYLKMADLEIADLRVGSTVVIDDKVFMKAGEAFACPEQWTFVRSKLKTGEIPDPWLIEHIYKPYKIWLWYSYPFSMVENDWAIGIDPATGRYRGHPRGAGSFARFLGYWVRERGVCDLMTALSKTSTLAAAWLGLDSKGRIQVGCDADLTLFDPDKVIDKATYVEPGIPSSGIPYVIVNGVVAVSDGKLTGQLAGKVIRRTWEIPGIFPRQGDLPGTGIEDLGG
jgi:N-acyl-D-amino-acid deacylase